MDITGIAFLAFMFMCFAGIAFAVMVAEHKEKKRINARINNWREFNRLQRKKANVRYSYEFETLALFYGKAA